MNMQCNGAFIISSGKWKETKKNLKPHQDCSAPALLQSLQFWETMNETFAIQFSHLIPRERFATKVYYVIFV